MNEFSLICCIVNDGDASKVIKITKNAGAKGATVFYGKGLVKNKILEFLGIDYSFKEIVLIVVEKEKSTGMLSILNDAMSLHKSNRGIAFSVLLNNFIGTRHIEYFTGRQKSEEGMYEVIFTVVNRGSAEEVIQAAKSEGAKGGTIINARGSGIHETEMLFAMQIEPEKEIVMILVKNELTQKIVEAICTKLKIRDPGNGIVFVFGVNEAVGLIG